MTMLDYALDYLKKRCSLVPIIRGEKCPRATGKRTNNKGLTRRRA